MAGPREPAGLTASAIVVDHVLCRREGTRRRAPSIRVAAGALVVFGSMIRAERVAFILNDVFGCPFTEVPRSPAAARRPAASWPRRPAAASAPHGLPRPRRPGGPASSGTSKGLGSQGHRRPHRHPRPRSHRDRRWRRTRHSRPAPTEGGEQIARFHAAIAGIAPNGAILERMVDGPARPGGPAGRRRDGIRVRHRRRPDQAHLGSTDPEKLRPWTID